MSIRSLFPLPPPTEYKTYKDVKTNLQFRTWMLLLFPIMIIYPFIFPFSDIKSHWAFLYNELEIVGLLALTTFALGLLIGITGVLSHSLIFDLQIHDRFYDAHVTKWRQLYDVDVILRALTSPIQTKIPEHIFNMTVHDREARHAAMRPFYDFVGDDVDEYIRGHLRERFYNIITKYWVTQVTEMFLIFFIIGLPILSLVFSSTVPVSTDPCIGS